MSVDLADTGARRRGRPPSAEDRHRSPVRVADHSYTAPLITNIGSHSAKRIWRELPWAAAPRVADNTLEVHAETLPPPNLQPPSDGLLYYGWRIEDVPPCRAKEL